jgi:hypothetical protein
MARIRTIKPEFFTSEDIVLLSPMARLFYIALWCEADREGRLVWKPRTFKLRYFPGDDCDMEAIAAEVIERELIVLYEVDGVCYAEIPTFAEHQYVNNRESHSNIPARVSDASRTREIRVQGEGKGKERKGRNKSFDASQAMPSLDSPPDPPADPPAENPPQAPDPRGTRLPADWQLPKALGDWALKERPGWTPDHIRVEAEKFADYWHGRPGAAGRKSDWPATWRNWIRNANGIPSVPAASAPRLAAI